MTTAASNKPPPSTKVRLEELDLDDRVSGSRSNDTLEDSSGSRLPEVTPGADPVDAEGCCDPRSLLPGLDGRGIRVPMKRKVSSSGFSSLGTSGGSGVDGGIDLQFGGYRFNERGRLQKRQEWKCGSQTGQRRTMHRRRSELTPTPRSSIAQTSSINVMLKETLQSQPVFLANGSRQLVSFGLREGLEFAC